MLHFTKMTLTNFGPYKGSQQIDFTDKHGVTIFWGDNGRGKTTLLNAFRYALFGTIQRRNGVLRSLREMENVESREDGVYGFSVVLSMDNDGTKYELTRQLRPRKNITNPKNDEDYERVMFLKKNGTILSISDSEHELNVIMPEQVSRFFLFDGELLQEYEELLENETSTGERIKEAIEKILGVPVITNGLVDIGDCLYNYEKQKSKATQKDVKTQQYGIQLEAIDTAIAGHRSEEAKLKSTLSDLYKEKMTLDQKSEETQQVREWLASKEAAVRGRQQREAELETVESKIKETLRDAWKGMLSTTISGIVEDLQTTIAELEKKKQNKAVADKFINELKRACSEHKCPVCEQEIAGDLVKRLQERIDRSESEFSGLTEEEKELLLACQARFNTIRQLKIPNRKAALQVLEERRLALEIDIGTFKQEISELSSKIAKYGDTSKVATIAQQLAAVLSKIQITEDGIKKEQAEITKLLDNRSSIQNLIEKQNVGADLLLATKQCALCNQINQIFELGKTRYREKLKANVEKDATDLFVHLSSDRDYVGLQIHDNYGLSIVHKSGNLVPGRSSGFEHIVALSLIGALHKNAPLRGPIIMDSPFGRLDPTHKRNIVRQLPDMAEQSMLLAYTGEIDEHVARDALAGNLIREYKLNRVSSMHTRIE